MAKLGVARLCRCFNRSYRSQRSSWSCFIYQVKWCFGGTPKAAEACGIDDFPHPSLSSLSAKTQANPNYALAWTYLGAAYTSDAAFELGGREQYRRAQAAYERALALEPSELDAQMFLANLLVDTGQVEKAVPLLRGALKANDNYAPVHWELGYAYRFAGMLNESVAECERARQIDPLVKSNGSVLNAYLYVGQYDRFLASLPEVNDSSFLLFYCGFGEYYRKDLEQASKISIAPTRLILRCMP